MPKVYILNRSQRVMCCRIASATVAAYLMENSRLLNGVPLPKRPKLVDYLFRLKIIMNVLNEISQTLSNKPLEDMLKKYTTQHWLNGNHIDTLNNLINSSPDLKAQIDLYFEIRDNDDPLKLKAYYNATLEDLKFTPEFDEIERITYTCEMYFVKNHSGSTGLEHHEVRQALMTQEFINDIALKETVVALPEETEMQEIHGSEGVDALERINGLFDDSIDNEVFQMTSGGHSTAFGKKAHQYWQFDSADVVVINNERYLCSTLKIFDNKQEALNHMKLLAKGKDSQYAKLLISEKPNNKLKINS